MNNKVYKTLRLRNTISVVGLPVIDRDTDIREQKQTNKRVTVRMRWLPGIPTRNIDNKKPRRTVNWKSANMQPDRRCKIFLNYKKWYLPSLPIYSISVFVLAETCSSATRSFLPSLQGSPVAIEESHAVRDFKISNNGGQTFYNAHPLLFYLGWWTQG